MILHLNQKYMTPTLEKNKPLSFAAVNKMTLLDFPGHVAAVLFTQGCNFSCFYCHNPLFISPLSTDRKGPQRIPFEAIKAFLVSRVGFLDGVVISGGEPTLHKGLADTLAQIKSLGYKVKLDTNGSHPQVVQDLLNQKVLDYIAMDYKCLPKDYSNICGFEMDSETFQSSLEVVAASGIPYELRTTVWEEYHTLKCLEEMGQRVKGIKSWALQNIRLGNVLGDCSNITPYNPARLEKYITSLSRYAQHISIR